jgi:hypothetical protein
MTHRTSLASSSDIRLIQSPIIPSSFRNLDSGCQANLSDDDDEKEKGSQQVDDDLRSTDTQHTITPSSTELILGANQFIRIMTILQVRNIEIGPFCCRRLHSSLLLAT